MKKYVFLFIVPVFILTQLPVIYSQCVSAEPAKAKIKQQTSPKSSSIPTCSAKPISAELNKLLEEVEKACTKLQSFQADMIYRQKQILIEDLTTRNGKLYYRVDKDRILARIHFDDFLQQDLTESTPGKAIKFDEDIAFDGMWVTHRNERTKHIIYKQLSRTPHNKEAFRLGRGDPPLPFAITKKDSLEHFDIQIVKPDPNDPKNTSHLLLKPKKKSPYGEKYIQMNLWIDHKTHLPIQISYEKDDFEITTISWSKIKINEKIKDKIFKLKSPGRGWTEEKFPLEESPANLSTK